MQRITPEDQRTLKKKFPKFNRICACYVNNPQYGLSLSPEAKRLLNRGKNAEKKQRKSKVISARVDVDDVEKLNSYLKANGLTISDFINKTVKETVHDDT